MAGKRVFRVVLFARAGLEAAYGPTTIVALYWPGVGLTLDCRRYKQGKLPHALLKLFEVDVGLSSMPASPFRGSGKRRGGG